ncbi:MAG TPA: hypothetical protein LFW20_07375 [Rickettsia endosymbiont of Omalisus fontisbellaquei]|nr:hypothetical protein [Rickettsia endosymbiont of Omalisus fontisbellaquei]
MLTDNDINDLKIQLEDYNRWIEDKPTNHGYWHSKGNILTRIAKLKGDMSQCNEALECYNKAIELNMCRVYLTDRSKDRLTSAMNEADVISLSGNIALNTFDLKNKAFSVGVSLIPVIGQYMSPVVEARAEFKQAQDIQQIAIKFKKVLSINPIDRQGILKKISEEATLKKKGQIENINNSSEILHWKNKDVITKCTDFLLLNVDNTTYGNNNFYMLGCIDAIKVIKAISTEQFNADSTQDEIIKQLVDVIIISPPMFQESIFPPPLNNKVVNIINQIEYDNPILNKSGLLQELSKSTGLSLYKVLDNSNILMQAGYENIITQAVNNHDVAKLGDLLLGID